MYCGPGFDDILFFLLPINRTTEIAIAATTTTTMISSVVPEKLFEPLFPELEPPVIVMVVDEISVVPFKVTATVRSVVPALGPAVNVTDEPEVELSVPRELDRDHVYASPEGQVPPSQDTEAL